MPPQRETRLALNEDRHTPSPSRPKPQPSKGDQKIELPQALTPSVAPHLDAILRPRTVAVIGASPNPASVGHHIFKNLLQGGFTGVLHPVHPTAKSIFGVRAYPDVMSIPDAVDLAVLVVPAAAVLDVAEQCGQRGVGGLLVISAGFKEIGGEGVEREKKLTAIVKKYGMRMVGPNCLGVMNPNPEVRLNATFAPTQPRFGPAAIMTQSGALGIAILENAKRIGLGLARFVSMGNKSDVSGNDLLLEWEDDPDVGLILMYLESFGNPRNFVRIARRVGRKKPILVVKSGRSQRGAKAAGSHTGALAETDRIVEALFEQCGILRARTIIELFDYSAALALQPLPKGNRVAIVTNSGGPAIMAVDAMEGTGLEPADFGPAARDVLRQILPPEGSATNPVDLLAAGGPRQFRAVLDAVLADEGVDAAIAIYTPPIVTNETEIADAIVGAHRARPDKPLLAVFMGQESASPGFVRLATGGVPAYVYPESPVRALVAMRHLAEYRARPEGHVPEVVMDRSRIESTLQKGNDRPGGWLALADALDVMEACGLRVVPRALVTNEEEALTAAETIGYPLVMKADAAGLVHKTEVGAVQLDLRTAQQVRDAYRALTERLAKAGFQHPAIMVMQQVQTGTEVLVGATQDPKFGPLIAFGLGGIHAEALQDVVFRLAPLTDADAHRMVRSLRAQTILEGTRGARRRDYAAIEDAVLRISRLAMDHPILQELDLNPVFLGAEGKGLFVVDARVRVRPQTHHDPAKV